MCGFSTFLLLHFGAKHAPCTHPVHKTTGIWLVLQTSCARTSSLDNVKNAFCSWSVLSHEDVMNYPIG